MAIVAPSSPFNRDAFERGVKRLRGRYEVQYDESLFDTQGYLAGSDARRLAELLRVLADDSVDMIVGARGGYGATRLLPDIEIEHVSKARKLLVGFSDLTALHALWQRAGVRSIHGPMVCSLGDEGEAGDRRFQQWVNAIEGNTVPSFDKLDTVVGGAAEGPLMGGNLSVLCALANTPYAPRFDDSVLFLEDIGERPYRVDRMLTSLLQDRTFSRVAAVVVGQFTESTAGKDGVTVEQVIRERLGNLRVPVLMGLPAGHIEDNAPLPFGALASVNATSGSLTFAD